MGDRLTIYRGALRLLGDATIASLTEANSRRLKLDEAWNPSVEFMLEQGLWNFAIRDVSIEADTDVEPIMGYQHAFEKPDDWKRTANISNNSFYTGEFEDFDDRGNLWYANVDTLFIGYVSNGVNWGWNVGAWRQSFCKTLEAYLAFECGLPISNDKGNRDDLYGLYEKRLKNAKAKDAVDERVQRQPVGRLVRSRSAYGSRYGSR